MKIIHFSFAYLKKRYIININRNNSPIISVTFLSAGTLSIVVSLNNEQTLFGILRYKADNITIVLRVLIS